MSKLSTILYKENWDLQMFLSLNLSNSKLYPLLRGMGLFNEIQDKFKK